MPILNDLPSSSQALNCKAIKIEVDIFREEESSEEGSSYDLQRKDSEEVLLSLKNTGCPTNVKKSHELRQLLIENSPIWIIRWGHAYVGTFSSVHSIAVAGSKALFRTITLPGTLVVDSCQKGEEKRNPFSHLKKKWKDLGAAFAMMPLNWGLMVNPRMEFCSSIFIDIRAHYITPHDSLEGDF